jgi:hypothetical protein
MKMKHNWIAVALMSLVPLLLASQGDSSKGKKTPEYAVVAGIIFRALSDNL